MYPEVEIWWYILDHVQYDKSPYRWVNVLCVEDWLFLELIKYAFVHNVVNILWT